MMMKIFEVDGMCPLLLVWDMPTSVRFYTDVLGFDIVETSDGGERYDWAWLRRDGADLMLNNQYEDDHRPAAPHPTRTAWHRDTGPFFNCPDVDGVYRHLLAHGLEVEPPVVRDYGMRQVSVLDPDGYHLCFQWPAEEPRAQTE